MVCMACRAAKKHWKRLVNERKQEKSPAHFNEKWCAAKCARRAEGVRHGLGMLYAPLSGWQLRRFAPPLPSRKYA